jgi:hypothetical protein
VNHVDGDAAGAASRALEREVALVESAIEMVAKGHASRMELGGLSFGDALLDHARRAGAERRVRVTPRWGLGEEGLALVFEPVEAEQGAPDA